MLGRIVHYVDHLGQDYAAIVCGTGDKESVGDYLELAVLNPRTKTVQWWAATEDQTAITPGSWHYPEGSPAAEALASVEAQAAEVVGGSLPIPSEPLDHGAPTPSEGVPFEPPPTAEPTVS
jgi:hypothetical protein